MSVEVAAAAAAEQQQQQQQHSDTHSCTHAAGLTPFDPSQPQPHLPSFAPAAAGSALPSQPQPGDPKTDALRPPPPHAPPQATPMTVPAIICSCCTVTAPPIQALAWQPFNTCSTSPSPAPPPPRLTPAPRALPTLPGQATPRNPTCHHLLLQQQYLLHLLLTPDEINQQLTR